MIRIFNNSRFFLDIAKLILTLIGPFEFSPSKIFKFACSLGGFHIEIALKLLKYALCYSYHEHAVLFLENGLCN